MYYFFIFVSLIQLGGLEILSQMSEIVKISMPLSAECRMFVYIKLVHF